MVQSFPRELQQNQANLTPPGDYQLSKMQMYVHKKLWQFPHRQFLF